ncbi:MAG: hypothetical protein FK733_04280 [Asgard group archaeon]|nr:hypothetical protein [Asgard group archaeon]
MSKYDIKFYKEEFLESHEKVGKEATKDWSGFGQTSAEQLKQLYSQEGFDPDTKLYAFKGDNLVGFLTSSILPEDESGVKVANLEFPLTLAEHGDCAELLFNKAVETLKKKGVSKLQTRVGEPYKGTIEKAKKWGYTYSSDLYVLIEADVKKLKLKESDIKILDFDINRDLEDMVKIFMELGTTEEYARANFDRVSKDKENFPVHLIIREDDKVVGRVMAYRNPNTPNEFNFGNLYYIDEKYFEPLLSTALDKIKALDAKIASLFLYGPTLADEDKYISFGFSRVAKIDYYEKEI